MEYLTLTRDNIKDEHICCAFADKKCSESYALKKQWLTAQFANAYVFRRLDERAKVFIEYGPAERAWVPVTAPNYLMIGCFWVSGRFKGQGHGKALLNDVIEEAKGQGKSGLATVVGTKKFHFMCDTTWLLRQGFEIVDSTPSGFSLITMKFGSAEAEPCFNASVRSGACPDQKGIVVYYSNRCPYSEYHVKESLVETAKNRRLPLKAIKLDTMEQARSCPSPATIFSLFLDGAFVTTDISVCMDGRFDKIVGKHKA